MITFVVIVLMLLWVYRSIVTVVATMLMVFIELMAARRSHRRSWLTTTSSGCRPSR